MVDFEVIYLPYLSLLQVDVLRIDTVLSDILASMDHSIITPSFDEKVRERTKQLLADRDSSKRL